MKKEITEYYCDVCEDRTAKDHIVNQEMQMIFLTEQTEGRPVAPYFSNQKIDLCPDCCQTALGGSYIFGQGAMGHNKYFFKNKKEAKK